MESKSKNEELDRVRASSADQVNAEIDDQMEQSVRQYAGRSRKAITDRIETLEREWDTERTLELNASSLALTGLILGVTVNKKWLIVPGIVLPFLLQHATQGWCPPLPILRRMGIRTRKEIDREKYAMKALRGDFSKAESPASAMDAVRA